MYSIKNITLLEASFNRDLIIDFNNEIINDANISIEVSKNKSLLGITLTVDVKGISNNLDLYSMRVVTNGAFEHDDTENEESIENFCRVNAPAIIFPFIRETIASITSKAGIETVLLPPLNFTHIYQEDLAKNSKTD